MAYDPYEKAERILRGRREKKRRTGAGEETGADRVSAAPADHQDASEPICRKVICDLSHKMLLLI